MEELANSKWKTTRVGTPPLKGGDLQKLISKLNHNWEQVEELKLQKDFKFTNFNRALEFANLVGKMSDELNHHPDLHLAWGKCVVQIWTHRIDGISQMDFVYAARVEEIYQNKFSNLIV
ncbi:MAG: 4a-hydroxytetrahydrobiopterin dehydratase [Candidatus Heimdallarchaeota archaeon]|nr:4a-hydroxytetrahydrobiopterin dehydratase [Candidatus Heimdallarchaeota archaeon]